MRDLFISERRYIRNIVLQWTGQSIDFTGPVIHEEYAAPRIRRRVRFNTDYSLQFVSNDDRRHINSRACCSTILPNTLGADVFVSIDESTQRPFRTELLAGEAFSLKYFQEHVEKIEARMAELECPVILRKVAYCRIFVIGNDICFLAFPDECAPIARGKTCLLSSSDDSEISCSLDNDRLVYVDGWVRTAVTTTEWKCVAAPVS